MKKILLTVVALFLVNILQVKAQERNLTDAWFALKNNELLNAKKSIDEAYVHESTKNSAKMFLYRGDVYIRLRGMADADSTFKEAANKSSIIAAESYFNYLSSTEKKKKSDLEGVYQQMTYAASYCLFDGGRLFENEQYAEAMKYFEAAYNLTKYDVNENLKENGMTSNSILLNLYSTAESMGDRAASRKYLNALIDNKYADANLYIYLARSYYAEGDTTTGFKKLLEGREKYPENRFLLMEEMQYYMDKGEIDILLKKFNEVIESEPESDLNYFYRGSLYHQKRNYESAEKDYLKSIELNPNNFDAKFNLGALYIDMTAPIEVNMRKNAGNINFYMELEDQKYALYDKARPHIEEVYLSGKITDQKEKIQLLEILRDTYKFKKDREKVNFFQGELDKARSGK